MGIPFASDLMNFVVLTAIISAGNSGLYASTRMLWSLGNEGLLVGDKAGHDEDGADEEDDQPP
ncbi:hypothetical protein [Lactobacillus delbrueckii]